MGRRTTCRFCFTGVRFVTWTCVPTRMLEIVKKVGTFRGGSSRVIWVWLLATVAGCGEDPLPVVGSDAVAIVGATLIDGTGVASISDAVVVIADGRIQAVGTRANTELPKGVEVIEAVGQTVMPGLVETHAHYQGEIDRVEWQYRKQLYLGVTTSRSIGTDTAEKVARALDARNGQIPGPRMYTAGLGFSVPDGFPPGLPVNRPVTEEEARSLVGDLADQGVHFIKIWVNDMPEPGLKIPREMRRAIVDEALQRNLIPVGHVIAEADLRQLVETGVRDFLHTIVDTEIKPDLLQLMIDTGLTFSPTLTNIEANWYWAEHPELLDDPQIRAVFEPEALERWNDPAYRENVLTSDGLAEGKERLRESMAFLKTVVDAGVSVATGTDSGAPGWDVPMGWGTHREMQLYVEAGLTPMQAIVAATRIGADLLSQGTADYGTLEPGNRADLIILNADPLGDIANTLDIDRVMQGGEWIDRVALMPVQ